MIHQDLASRFWFATFLWAYQEGLLHTPCRRADRFFLLLLSKRNPPCDYECKQGFSWLSLLYQDDRPRLASCRYGSFGVVLNASWFFHNFSYVPPLFP